MYHELIDKDIPKCLFCNSDVDYKLTSEWIGQGTSLRQDVEKLTCKKCKEVFYIMSNQDDIGETKYTSFTFSCNKIWLHCSYMANTFVLGNSMITITKNPIIIPPFQIDFSDKEKLYEKLKTYIVFS